MELKEVISITGKPGLYRIVAQSGKGFIVESIEDTKTKFPVNANHQVAILDEITIYTEDEANLTLKEVLENMKGKGESVPSPNADPVTLRNFFKEVAPNHDENRVYISDMKKILKWYTALTTAGVV